MGSRLATLCTGIFPAISTHISSPNNRLYIFQLLTFSTAKIIFSLVEMPQAHDDYFRLPYLLPAAILYLMCILSKLYMHRSISFARLLHVQIEAFILWLITILNTIFSLGLSQALDWRLADKICVVVCLVLQSQIFILITSPQLVSKREFLFFEGALTVNILVIALRTVHFISKDEGSAFKDIVLLNLTTQIALAIVFMDVIERAYQRYKERKDQQREERSKQEAHLEKELVETA